MRITGGEPLLRKGLPDLINRLKQIEGIDDIAITTNGSLLKKHAEALSKAGLSRVTVSLDSLDEVRFQELNGNRGSVKRVLEGIEAAALAGISVKINMVVQKARMSRIFFGWLNILKTKNIRCVLLNIWMWEIQTDGKWMRL